MKSACIMNDVAANGVESLAIRNRTSPFTYCFPGLLCCDVSCFIYLLLGRYSDFSRA
jgi:hypothetical protein